MDPDLREWAASTPGVRKLLPALDAMSDEERATDGELRRILQTKEARQRISVNVNGKPLRTVDLATGTITTALQILIVNVLLLAPLYERFHSHQPETIVSASIATLITVRSAGCCGARASTSCRSCSTCCSGR